MLVILPSDPLRPRRPDEHFESEWEGARDLGFEVAVVDHDALARPGGAAAAVRRITGPATAVYRGWMLRSARYAEFAAALADRNVTLVTTAEQYRRAHELPGWYEALRTITPESTWTEGAERADFETCLTALGSGPAVLRDYTKSMKHYWHEAAFIPEVSDVDGAWRIAARFLDLRDDEFTGGFVLRRYEDFTSTEARTWWVNGQLVFSGSHPDTTDAGLPSGLDTAEAAPLVKALGLPFVTVDFVRHADGRWRVVELGDGQVSDRPSTVSPETLLSAVLKPLAT